VAAPGALCPLLTLIHQVADKALSRKLKLSRRIRRVLLGSGDPATVNPLLPSRRLTCSPLPTPRSRTPIRRNSGTGGHQP
jgi:hypothetical protein